MISWISSIVMVSGSPADRCTDFDCAVKLTFIVIVRVVVVVVVSVVTIVIVPVVLLEATGAETSDVLDVEAVVGANALPLQEVLVAIAAASREIIDVAAAGQLDDGLADIAAGRGHVVAVELQIGKGGGGERREEKEVLCLEHVGCELRSVKRSIEV